MEVYQNEQSTSDDVPIEYYDTLYHVTNGNARTPLTTAFFSAQNLSYVLQRIGFETGRMLNRQVVVIANADFFTYVQDQVRGVGNLMDVNSALGSLNDLIVAHEVGVQYLSLRRRELFFKWFIFKDRPRVIEPPMNTYGRRRYEQPSYAEFHLQDPKKQYFADWLVKQGLQ